MGLEAGGALLLHRQLRGDRRLALERAETVLPAAPALPISLGFITIWQCNVPLLVLVAHHVDGVRDRFNHVELGSKIFQLLLLTLNLTFKVLQALHGLRGELHRVFLRRRFDLTLRTFLKLFRNIAKRCVFDIAKNDMRIPPSHQHDESHLDHGPGQMPRSADPEDVPCELLLPVSLDYD